jgi:hypothetical protein
MQANRENHLVLLAIFMTAAFATPPGDAMAYAATISCAMQEVEPTEAQARHLDGICAELRALVDAANYPDDLQIELNADRIHPTLFRGFLAWQMPGDRGSGPMIEFGFTDTELSQTQYGFVARGLLNATNLPTRATNGL